MGAGGFCHECKRYHCECPAPDPVDSARAEFIRDVVQACRKFGVTIDADIESLGYDVGFVSAALTDSGFGFRVGIEDIEEAIRLSDGGYDHTTLVGVEMLRSDPCGDCGHGLMADGKCRFCDESTVK